MVIRCAKIDRSKRINTFTMWTLPVHKMEGVVCAAVTGSAETAASNMTMESLLDAARNRSGVLCCKILAG